MSELSSVKLRSILEDLEVTAERASAATYAATLDHEATIKAAVISGDHASTERSEAALRAARREADRLADVLDHARQLHADALQRERAAVQAEVRGEVETDLVEMAVEAADIDAVLVAAVGRILNLRTRELALRRKVRDSFSEVSGGPEFLSALRSVATHLTTISNTGEQHAASNRITMAAASGISSIRRVIHGR